MCSLINKIEDKKLDYFVVSTMPDIALKTVFELRKKGFSAEFDMQKRKFAKQLEKASKIANKAVIIGEDEIKGGYYTVKDLTTGVQTREEKI